ncbi:MAG: hypothetical protein AAF997_18425 [Myxococcota bacterium]
MFTPNRTIAQLTFTLGALALLNACGDSVGRGSASLCQTNVEGCTAATYSCPQARLCYPSATECQASGECGAAGGAPGDGAPGDETPGGGVPGGGVPGGGASGCTTNVDGCDPAAFSCPVAQLCYASAADCQASGECQPGGGAPGGGLPGGALGGGGAPTGDCRTNVDGCDPSAFSCDVAQRCYGSAADCDASGECG